jgi:glutamyl-tRNA reductase
VQIGVAGVSHHAAPVSVRERFVLGPHQIEDALQRVTESEAVREALLLSTCNRTELYVVGGDDALAASVDFLAAHAGMGEAGREYVYVRNGRPAAEHLIRVAAGLDSMVIGEAQIQGQVRTAYEHAQRTGSAGPVLARLAERALSVGALVRTETGLGKRGGSVATAVVEVARKIFGTLGERRALIVGAGEMSELVLETFLAQRIDCTLVTTRGEERARGIAEKSGAGLARFEALASLLPDADILVSATAAPHSVIRRSVVGPALEGRRGPVLMIDLALPRDIDPEIGAIDDVFLYDMDDLQHVIERREAWWKSELGRAETLVQAGLEDFHGWYRSRSAVPVIRELRDRVDAMRDAELERALRRLGHLSEADRQVVERLATQLAAKILHGPLVRMREAAREDGQHSIELVEAARYLFNLGAVVDEDAPQWKEEGGAA